jgi:hypothetical protein
MHGDPVRRLRESCSPDEVGDSSHKENGGEWCAALPQALRPILEHHCRSILSAGFDRIRVDAFRDESWQHFAGGICGNLESFANAR